jgi:hypothetical protein
MTAVTHVFRFSGGGEDFGPRGYGMATGHTWEGPYNALTVEDGMALLRWQDEDANLGSYNRVCAVDGVISAVPDDHASGGINPASSFWAPKAWLREFLSPEEIANPNYFTLNVVALGRRSWFDANGWPDGIIDGMARSWIDEERRTGIRIVWTGHSDFQSNRSDCGAIATALVKQRYAELTGQAPMEIDMSFLDLGVSAWYVNRQVLVRAGASVRASPSYTAEDPAANIIRVLAADEQMQLLARRSGTALDGSSRWYAVVNGTGKTPNHGWVHSSDVLSASAVEASWVTGVPPEQLAAAEAKAREDGAEAEKDRIAALLGL